ncbi:low molecular weight protein-tyrosine-phosphatase [Paenibacillus physcomitrellae]|uniref:protein-tyrosine-phosphatase n=1 Tax=Paenibacillus physcomitrellae TaxID=1619311 RepID=A0ABQ1FX43_9BACL|nr:low molecular weight protein-tyrosine-phosphatase [Paenibacillus physcomitrellae]GGA32116.1 phosphotyrosine protein phosphatase [Paenibacillus physcomitrellae]
MTTDQQHKDKIGVLFVCLGNICRSPMAEAMFRHLVQQEGLADRFNIDSAGTGDWHTGNPPHQGTRTILDRYGISYEGLRARQVAANDFSDFDYIIAMDDSNVSNLRKLMKGTSTEVIKLLDLVPDVKLKDVPDPYYTGNFDETYELVGKGNKALLEHIRREHNL